MSLGRKIAGHTLLQVIGKLAGNVIGVIVVGLLTRYLGEEGFGNYTTILAYLFFFSSLADLGLYIFTINEINQHDRDRARFFSAIYSLRFISAVVLMILAGLLVWLLPYPDVVKLGVIVVSLSMFFSLLDQMHVAYFQSQLSMLRSALADVSGKVVLLAGVAVSIALHVPLVTLLWSLVFGQGIHFLINFIGIRQQTSLSFRFDWSYWRDILSRTWPIALSQVFVLVYFKMDVVFLSLLRPSETAQVEVGIYGAPYKFLEVLISFVPLFMGLVAPMLSRARARKRMDQFRALYQQSFDAFAIVTLPLVAGGIMLARPIMNIVAPGFSQSDVVLQILMVAIGIIFFAHLPTYTVNTLGQQRSMLPGYGIAAFLAAVLYVVLIPQFSIYAAAGVSVVIELLILTLAWRKVVSITHQRIQLTIFFKSLIASVTMSVVLYMMRDLSLFVLLFIGGCVYLGVMFLSRGMTVSMIKSLISSPSSE